MWWQAQTWNALFHISRTISWNGFKISHQFRLNEAGWFGDYDAYFVPWPLSCSTRLTRNVIQFSFECVLLFRARARVWASCQQCQWTRVGINFRFVVVVIFSFISRLYSSCIFSGFLCMEIFIWIVFVPRLGQLLLFPLLFHRSFAIHNIYSNFDAKKGKEKKRYKIRLIVLETWRNTHTHAFVWRKHGTREQIQIAKWE